MKYLLESKYITSADASRHAPSLEKQRGAPERKQSNVLMWTGLATKLNLATLKKERTISVYAYAIFRIFHCFTLPSDSF